jgi:hypothetical protein
MPLPSEGSQEDEEEQSKPKSHKAKKKHRREEIKKEQAAHRNNELPTLSCSNATSPIIDAIETVAVVTGDAKGGGRAMLSPLQKRKQASLSSDLYQSRMKLLKLFQKKGDNETRLVVDDTVVFSWLRTRHVDNEVNIPHPLPVNYATQAAIKGVLYDIFMGSRQVQRPIFHTTLMEAFRNYPSANLNIFGSKAKSLPTPQKIKQMLLMLLAAGILDFNVKKENTEITILATLKWDAEHDLFVFQNNDAWALIRNKSI